MYLPDEQSFFCSKKETIDGFLLEPTGATSSSASAS